MFGEVARGPLDREFFEHPARTREGDCRTEMILPLTC